MYTPYQPEISQGRLEALLNFQTMVCDLTAMEIANASLLDEATAAAEAMAMLHRLDAKGGSTFFVDVDCHPQTLDVVRTRAEPIGIEVVVGDPDLDLVGEGIFGVLVQYPASSGHLRDLRSTVDRAHAMGARVAVAADLLALAIVVAPGECGADVVVGSAQRFGVPLGFGGPHAAFLATRDEFKRSVPGRIVGVSVDASGRPALRLALQTREQHIRREKATSNICTAQVLLANIAGLYAAYHGPEGLRAIAERVHRHACRLADLLERGGHTLVHDTFFDTLTVRTPGRAAAVLASARAHGGSTSVSSTPTPSGSPSTRRPPMPSSRRSRVRCSAPSTNPARPPAFASPRRSGAPPTSSCTRCSAGTTRRPRCSATFAGSRTVTWRSTAR